MDAVDSIVKTLGSSIENVRDAAFKRVRPYLRDTTNEAEDMAMKLWKGLFYGMWNLDGSTRQLEMAGTISECVLDEDIGIARRLMFWKAFLATLRREWITIDQYRLDKYYALGRKMLHAVWVLALRTKWSHVEFFSCLDEEILSNRRIASGIPFHFVEIYVEELDKALQEEACTEISQRGYVCILFPFVKTLQTPAEQRPVLKKKIHSLVFKTLQEKIRGSEEEENFCVAVQLLGLDDVLGTSSASTPVDERTLEAKEKLLSMSSSSQERRDLKRGGGGDAVQTQNRKNRKKKRCKS